MKKLLEEFYEYKGVFYRRLRTIKYVNISDTTTEERYVWVWFKKIEKYNHRLKRYIKEWKAFKPSEAMKKTYLRQKKFERILGDD